MKTALSESYSLLGGGDRQHQVLVFCAGKHGVGLSWIGNIRVPRIARHFSNHGADDHHMRAGLHPMLMRRALMGVVVAGSGIPGQHIDEADLVWRLGFRGYGFRPCHAILIGAERRAIWTDQTGVAIGAGLKCVWVMFYGPEK